jgi:hypothetical protein
MQSMVEFQWIPALSGGVLIGVSATLLLALTGRIAGISGIVNGAIAFKPQEAWRWVFLLGMVLGGGLYEYALAPQPTPLSSFAPGLMIVGGCWWAWAPASVVVAPVAMGFVAWDACRRDRWWRS